MENFPRSEKKQGKEKVNESGLSLGDEIKAIPMKATLARADSLTFGPEPESRPTKGTLARSGFDWKEESQSFWLKILLIAVHLNRATLYHRS